MFKKTDLLRIIERRMGRYLEGEAGRIVLSKDKVVSVRLRTAHRKSLEICQQKLPLVLDAIVYEDYADFFERKCV